MKNVKKPNKAREPQLSAMEKLALLRAQMDAVPDEQALEKEKKKKEQLETEKRQRAARAASQRSRITESDRAEQALRKSIMREKTADALKQGHSSRAKAAGLKSTFVLAEDEMLMTSFGKGNDAICEKKIHGDTVVNIAEAPAFSVTPRDDQFMIKGRVNIDASADNPTRSAKKTGQDLIGNKEQLEQLFFGQTFQDNIHIQLAYSILDIDKILAVHVNNVVFELNNMLRSEELEYNDIIGSLGVEQTWDGFFKKEKSVKRQQLQNDVQKLLDTPQLSYFGTVLYDPALIKNLKKARKPQEKERLKNELEQKQRNAYSLLCLLGMMRQAIAHGEEGKRTAIFTMDEGYDSMVEQKGKISQRIISREALNVLYGERVKELNWDFLQKAKVDLKILFSIYNAYKVEDKKRIVQAYYDFIVRKEYKNKGFSIKRLREWMLLEPEAAAILSTHYDSMRSRLYRTMDLMLSMDYDSHPEEGLALVEKLRGAMEEENKEQIYREEAGKEWLRLKQSILNDLLPWMEGTELKSASEATPDADVTPEMIQEIAIKPKASAFSEMMYLLTNFLDGKEINDLLTTLINKFENIAGFIAVMKEQGIPCKFSRGYGMFNRSKDIAVELRTINSFARMSKEPPEAKRPLFIEAAQVLGYPGDEEALGKFVDDVLNEKGEFTGKGKGFRNFIANNVIESDRFKYLVRYANVKTVRKLADNRALVAFVLRDIPDTQIIRYYNSCTGSTDVKYMPDMRNKLTDMITGISFEQFASVQQKAKANTPEAEDKVRKQAIIRLYLTVLYLAVKNLVYVNSRYFLAFHCAERDSLIADPKNREHFNNKYDMDYIHFARERIEEGRVNAYATKYIRRNMENSDRLMVQGFRNCVEHLGAVRFADRYIEGIRSVDSYFALYHYLVQMYLIEDYESSPEVVREMVGGRMKVYLDLVRKHHCYCKDMVKALNVPFAYNLPRYKNLSIEELFDRNHYLADKVKKEAVGPEKE